MGFFFFEVEEVRGIGEGCVVLFGFSLEWRGAEMWSRREVAVGGRREEK